MKGFKSHFVFSKNQQNGIFLLMAIILILQLVYFFSDKSSHVKLSAEESEIQEFQQQIDSLKSARTEATKDTIYPFNPNYITDYHGYMLGMEVEEIDRLHRFREEGNWVNSAEDFQRVTGVSDSLLAAIKIYFRFPEWVIQQQKKEAVAKRTPSVELQNLNTASAEQLQQISGVGKCFRGVL